MCVWFTIRGEISNRRVDVHFTGCHCTGENAVGCNASVMHVYIHMVCKILCIHFRANKRFLVLLEASLGRHMYKDGNYHNVFFCLLKLFSHTV